MSLLPLKFYGQPVLRKPAQAINKITPEIKELAAAMLETMNNAHGVGLAAPQVGHPLQLIVMNVGDEDHVLINPKIVRKTGKMTYNEGCLSLPGIFLETQRYGHVVVKARNLKGENVVLEGTDLLGICLQHEIDHLNGVLFVDRVEDRKEVEKSLKKLSSELQKNMWPEIPEPVRETAEAL